MSDDIETFLNTVGDGSVPMSWKPVDLSSVLDKIAAGQPVGPQAALMLRTDGVPLLYPGEVHSLAAEPESGKSWIAAAETARLLAAGERVLVLDFEDTAASIARRLVSLGADPAVIGRSLVYVRPEEPFEDAAIDALVAADSFALAVIDGVTEAYDLLHLDASSNRDVPTFQRKLPRRLAQSGAAVLMLDHVGKDREGRGRYAIGAQAKLASTAAAFGADVVERPSPGHAGEIRLLLHKDRHGDVRKHAISSRGTPTIAVVRILPGDDGTVAIVLDPPSSLLAQDALERPVVLMAAVAAKVAAEPGLGQNEIVRAVRGKGERIKLALRLLVAEGWIERRGDGRRYEHFAAHVFDADAIPPTDRVPVGPDRVPDPVATERVPGSPPVKGDSVPPSRAQQQGEREQVPRDSRSNVVRLPGARARRGAA